MATVVPGIVQIDKGTGVIVSGTEHGMLFELNEHRPASVNLSLVLSKGESISAIAVERECYQLVVIPVCYNAVAMRFDKELHAVAAIPEIRSVGRIIIRIPAPPVSKASAAIYVIPVVALVGAHEVGGAIGIPMLCPVAEVRVNTDAVGTVVVVHVPSCCQPVIALSRGAQGAVTHTPRGVGHGADSAVGGAGVHIGVPLRSLIIIAGHHGRRGC